MIYNFEVSGTVEADSSDELEDLLEKKMKEIGATEVEASADLAPSEEDEDEDDEEDNEEDNEEDVK